MTLREWLKANPIVPRQWSHYNESIYIQQKNLPESEDFYVTSTNAHGTFFLPLTYYEQKAKKKL